MQSASLSPILGLLSLLLFAACSSEESDSPSSTAAATPADMAAFCDAQCSFSEGCPDPDIVQEAGYDCRGNCAAKMGTNLVFRKASISAMTECYSTLSCNESDDQCTSEGVWVVTEDPVKYPGTAECLARHNECDASGEGGFSDDHCATRIILVPAGENSFDDCLVGACAEVAACFDAVIGRTR